MYATVDSLLIGRQSPRPTRRWRMSGNSASDVAGCDARSPVGDRLGGRFCVEPAQSSFPGAAPAIRALIEGKHHPLSRPLTSDERQRLTALDPRPGLRRRPVDRSEDLPSRFLPPISPLMPLDRDTLGAALEAEQHPPRHEKRGRLEAPT